MVEPTGKGALVPELPEMHGQTAQTAPTVVQTLAIVSVPPPSNQYLGQDIAADYSGLVQESGELVLNRAAVSAFNSHMMTLKEARLQAECLSAAERTKNDALSLRATDAERDVAVLKSRLESERQNSSLRLVLNALGGAAVGFIPYSYDKGGIGGGLVVACFGAVLLVAAWVHRSDGVKRAH